MSILYFTIASLATWRLSRILTKEVGPYHIVERFRNWIINEPWSPLYCIRCTTVWVAFLLASFMPQDVAPFGFVWLGLSGAAVLIDSVYEYFEPIVLNKEVKPKK